MPVEKIPELPPNVRSGWWVRDGSGVLPIESVSSSRWLCRVAILVVRDAMNFWEARWIGIRDLTLSCKYFWEIKNKATMFDRFLLGNSLGKVSGKREELIESDVRWGLWKKGFGSG
jgi:hypothetical protein